MGKGYLVSHQKVSINVGLNGKLHGYTELTITPTTGDIKTVWLNARDCTIISASLRLPNLIPLAFSHLPPDPPLLKSTDVHTYPELKRSVWKAANGGEEGELGISIPFSCIVKIPANDIVKEEKEKDKRDEWESIIISIEYSVTQPGVGIVVVAPDETNPSRFPHVFTSTADIAARTWVPCSDSLWDRCTWDLEFIVPRLLYSTSSDLAPSNNEDDDVEDELGGEWSISVVASGELIEQVAHPTRSDRIIWHYGIATPVSVQQVGWAVGPFVMAEIAPTVKPRGVLEEDEEEVIDEGPKLYALCLPGRESEMEHSVGVIRQAMDFYSTKFGSYPFSSYTIAFVDSFSSGSPTFHSTAMTLFSSDLLHPDSIIDQAYESRHLFAHALAVQWSGINLIPRAPADTWLITGIALHITSLFLKDLWGNNEYRFRLKKDMHRCVAQDIQKEPICVPILTSPHEPDQLQFIALKAPLVLHILDKQLRKVGTTLGLDKVLPKLFLDAITGDLGSHSTMTLNALSTSHFLRICRRACGGTADLFRVFSDQWIYGSGCPTFTIDAYFNRKRMAVELNVQQECKSADWARAAPWEESARTRPTIELFEGQLTIRIHEADGTPYEHVLSIAEKLKRHEVPFNTKYKRIRRNTKRYQARAAAAAAAALGDAEAQEDMSLVDTGFGLTLWEEEEEREKWRVADWTEEDDLAMSQATYEWIRVDADMDWICIINFTQPDFMWLSQLQRDRDVVAQLDALDALARMPSGIIASNLTKTVLVTNYFFRIRMEAVFGLVKCATQQQDYLGLFQLFKLFQTRYCFEPDVETLDPFGFRCIPQTNDFTDLTEYFLKKSIITAISMVRDERGQTPPAVRQFLMDLLAYNDNLGNRYSDTFYLTTLFDALANSLVSVTSLEVRDQFSVDTQTAGLNGFEDLPRAIAEANEEIDRYMSTDRLVPSYHNSITISGIQWKLKLMLANLIPKDLVPFFGYTREGNYPAVRLAAFDALLLLNTLESLPFIRYYFAVIRDDSSLYVRRRLAQSVLESMPILVALGDLALPVRKELTFEEDVVVPEAVEPSTTESVIKLLRNSLGKSLTYRACLVSVLSLPNLDNEIRDCLIKICETSIKPTLESVPKLTIKMPTISEAAIITLPPPVLQPIRLKLNAFSSALPKLHIPAAEVVHQDPSEDPDYEEESPEPPARGGHDSYAYTPKKVKVKTVTPVTKKLKAQGSGMSMADYKACNSVIIKLIASKVSLLFRNPVDPVKSGAPGYLDYVTSPMDLGTMSYKLAQGLYSNRDDFRADFKLVVHNAHIYNNTGFVVDSANEMDAMFNKLWTRVVKTLDTMAKTNKTPSSASFASPAVSATTAYPPYPSYAAAPAPIKLRLNIPAAPASTSTYINSPSTSTSGISLKFKMNPPSAYASTPAHPVLTKKIAYSASPSSYVLPSPALESAKSTSGFKVKFNTSGLGSATTNASSASTPPVRKIVSKYTDDYGNEMSSSIKIKPPSKKGKEKERGSASRESSVASSTVTYHPSLPAIGKAINDPINVKKAKGVMKKMLALPESWFFQLPVDAVGALATYYEEIKRPMDLQTLSQRLEIGAYRTHRDFFSAFSLILSNCKLFNPPGTEPVLHAEILDRAWRTEWEKASQMTPGEKRSVSQLINRLMKEGAAFPFLEPLDPDNQGFPEYFDFVPRGNLRDLSTIKGRLDADRYPSMDAVEADVYLMVENCHTFNAIGTPVFVSGEQVKAFFAAGISKIRAEIKASSSGGTKRMGEKAGGTMKKQKMV